MTGYIKQEPLQARLGEGSLATVSNRYRTTHPLAESKEGQGRQSSPRTSVAASATLVSTVHVWGLAYAVSGCRLVVRGHVCACLQDRHIQYFLMNAPLQSLHFTSLDSTVLVPAMAPRMPPNTRKRVLCSSTYIAAQ
jgi:hypothetical protein